MSESSKIRALVIEDEESFLGVLTTVLQSTERFIVVPCETGEEAVENLRITQFDLVILDHKLPGMSGLNVLQWMHEQKMEIPVIMLTGAGSENIAVESMKLGAYDYLRKDQFDKHHFPIFAAGVYERYLFHKEKKLRAVLKKDRDRNYPSLEMLEKSIYSLTQNVNTALTAIALMTEDSQTLLERMVPSETKELLQKNYEEMKQEYVTVATVTKSIIELTRLMFSRYAGTIDADQPEKSPPEGTSPVQSENARDRQDKLQ